MNKLVFKDMKKVYLAGPDIFRKDAVQYFEYFKALCLRHGFIALSPLDNNIGVTNFSYEEARKIFLMDMKMVRECDAVLANLSPFRGPSADAGTIFEIGAAHALGKIVVGYSCDLRNYGHKVGEFANDLNHPGVDFTEMTKDDFGCTDNLMIDFGVYESWGVLVPNPEQAVVMMQKALYEWKKAPDEDKKD